MRLAIKMKTTARPREAWHNSKSEWDAGKGTLAGPHTQPVFTGASERNRARVSLVADQPLLGEGVHVRNSCKLDPCAQTLAGSRLGFQVFRLLSRGVERVR